MSPWVQVMLKAATPYHVSCCDRTAYASQVGEFPRQGSWVQKVQVTYEMGGIKVYNNIPCILIIKLQ